MARRIKVDEQPSMKPRGRRYVSENTTRVVDEQAMVFAKRINDLMFKKGWSQTDLANEATKHMPAGKVMARDAINRYANGVSMPSQPFARAIAKAFGITIEQLIPPGTAKVLGRDAPVEMRLLPEGKARIKMDMELPAEQALQVMAIVNKFRT